MNFLLFEQFMIYFRPIFILNLAETTNFHPFSADSNQFWSVSGGFHHSAALETFVPIYFRWIPAIPSIPSELWHIFHQLHSDGWHFLSISTSDVDRHRPRPARYIRRCFLHFAFPFIFYLFIYYFLFFFFGSSWQPKGTGRRCKRHDRRFIVKRRTRRTRGTRRMRRMRRNQAEEAQRVLKVALPPGPVIGERQSCRGTGTGNSVSNPPPSPVTCSTLFSFLLHIGSVAR